MAIKTIHSTRSGAEAVLADLGRQYSDISKTIKPRMVLFFSNSNIDLQALNTGMKDIFAKADVFGCTTAGELISGLALKNSVVCMIFDQETIEDVKIEVIKNIKDNVDVHSSFKSFEYYYNVHMLYMDFSRYVGMVLIDGLSGAEEKLMESIARNTNIQFIGASAGDDLKYRETHVFANGHIYVNAALLILIKAKAKFGFIKTQSFNKLDKKLIATRVDESLREVIEFNNKPAVDAYSEALGIAPEDAAAHFMTNPVGIVIDDELYVRSPQQVVGKSMRFYCNIQRGSELLLLESTDIVEDTRKAVEKKAGESQNISGIINFHCILRAQQLDEKHQTDAYAKIFSGIPTIGFNTYGEELIYHINQTSTMLVFK
jgi:hypothetical protein